MQTCRQEVDSLFVTPMAIHKAWLICGLSLGLIGVGCQALRQVDWDQRVGQFSYEQAVVELGRPAGEAKLAGGLRRVEWITNSGVSGGRSLVGVGYRRSTLGVLPLEPTEIHRLRDRYLRLSFDKTGQLVAWESGTKTGN